MTGKTEREAVVKWLRTLAHRAQKLANSHQNGCEINEAIFWGGEAAFRKAADAIERGEHVTD